MDTAPSAGSVPLQCPREDVLIGERMLQNIKLTISEFTPLVLIDNGL